VFALKDYTYSLPADLIAQKPKAERDRSNLLILDRSSGRLAHTVFKELSNLLTPEDVLVVNNTAVIPARLHGRKESGGKVEVLISDYPGGCEAGTDGGEFVCRCLVKAAKRPKPGMRIDFDQGLRGEILESCNGTHTIKFHFQDDFESLLDRIGEVPLPPYIKRDCRNKFCCDDRRAYQTVYAAEKGAVAAPTAGLHFSEELLEKLCSRGVAVIAITLHVGYGTFLPVRVSDIRKHSMHSERFFITRTAADAVNSARTAGKRVVAVGTTCVRALEFASDDNGKVLPGGGNCDLFIFPGYRFKAVDAMITNFHLPQSTLLMLVSAFAGREKVFEAYREAIKRKYRFYSYGDAMLIV
jgi:S-adenosylmethionine:tRNA ribosyltransferase-isomerase